jgi:hypothetical protein
VIIRPSATDLLLITQPDHAVLAGVLMSAWQADGLFESPHRAAILLATTHHDDGWLNEDAAPIVDEQTGMLLDFIHAPETVRQRVWPVAVQRLADTPYAAALVAHHAISVYERHRHNRAWQPFFAGMEAIRDRHVRSAAPATLSDLERDYFFVRMGDLLSLAICNGWTEPQHHEAYDFLYDRDRLTISPDPFGLALSLSVRARCLPNRRFSGSREAAETFLSAPERTVTVTVTAAPRA